MRFVRGVVDFVVGDDWKIAAGVVAALALGALLVGATHARWAAPLAAAAVAVAFTAALLVDVRGGS